MKSTIKLTARGTYADGVNVSSLSWQTLATAIKVKLGMKV